MWVTSVAEVGLPSGDKFKLMLLNHRFNIFELLPGKPVTFFYKNLGIHSVDRIMRPVARQYPCSRGEPAQ